MKTHIITHHFNGTFNDRFASTKHHDEFVVDNWHKQRFGADFKSSLGWHIGYYKLFLEDGRVIKCRESWEEEAHTIGMNRTALGYGFAGNFTGGSSDRISNAQIESYKREAIADMKEFNIPINKIHPHRLYTSQKDCHGSQLPDDYFQKLLLGDKSAVEQEEKIKELQGTIDGLIKLVVRLLAMLNERKARTLGAISKRSSFREKLLRGRSYYKIR